MILADPNAAFRLGTSGLHRGPWASGEARHEPDQIATIVQPLIIDRAIAGGIGRALDQAVEREAPSGIRDHSAATVRTRLSGPSV